MRHTFFTGLLTFFLVISSLAIPAFSENHEPETKDNNASDPQVKQTMGRAFEALTELVDVALDQEFDRTESKKFIEALELMERLAPSIGDHTHATPNALNIVTRSLEDSVEQMVANYKAGFSYTGEEFLIETIDHCVACHTQSPELQTSIDVNEFVGRIYDEDIDTSLAARILVAVRKVPEAVQLWERRLLNKDFSLSAVGAEEQVLEYLSQVIHLQDATGNTRAVLADMRGRDDTPYYFKRKIAVWMKQLGLLDTVDPGALTLEKIQDVKNTCLYIEGRSVREEYPVCSFLVSSLSGKLLRQLGSDNREMEAELYVNMGVARLNTGLPAGYVPLIEKFLEAAILAAPDTDIARTAYAYLEELAYFLYNDIDVAEEIMSVSFDGLKEMAGIDSGDD